MFDFNEVLESPEYQNATPEAQLEVEALLAENFWTELTSDSGWAGKPLEEKEEYRKAFDQRFKTGQYIRARIEGQDNPLVRGTKKMVSSADFAGEMTAGDYKGAAENIKESVDYQQQNPGTQAGGELTEAWQAGDGILGGIKNVAGEIKEGFQQAPTTWEGVKSVGRDVKAMAGGVVEQTPNMVPPMSGMLAGGAAGSTLGPVGTVAGGWAGASAGNALVEGQGMAMEELRQAGIDPTDIDAVAAYLEENRGGILASTAKKAAIIGAVDTATMGVGGKMLTAPFKAASKRTLASMGVDLTDKAAIKSAISTTEFAAKVAEDTAYKSAMQGGENLARNTTVAALEPAGEFAGEYLGQGAATGDWDEKNAALEAFSSLGQSAATFSGQKAYQAAVSVKPTPKDIIDDPDIDTAIDTFTESVKSIDTKIAGIDAQVKGAPVDFGILSSSVDPIAGQINIQGAPNDTIRTAGNKLATERGIGGEKVLGAEVGGNISDAGQGDRGPEIGVGRGEGARQEGIAKGILGERGQAESAAPDYTESAINDTLYDFSDQAQEEQDMADARKRKNDFVNMRDEDQAITELNRRNQPEVEPDPQLSAPIQKTTPLSRIKKDYGIDVYNEVKAARGNGEAISVEEAINRAVKKQGGDVFDDTQGEQNAGDNGILGKGPEADRPVSAVGRVDSGQIQGQDAAILGDSARREGVAGTGLENEAGTELRGEAEPDAGYDAKNNALDGAGRETPANPQGIPQSAQYLGKSLGEHLYKDTDGTLYRSGEAPVEARPLVSSPAPESPGKVSPAPKEAELGRFDSADVEGTGLGTYSQAERELQGKAYKGQRNDDDILLDWGGKDGEIDKYVSFNDALALVKEAVDSGTVRPFSAQVNMKLGLTLAGADAVLKKLDTGKRSADVTPNLRPENTRDEKAVAGKNVTTGAQANEETAQPPTATQPTDTVAVQPAAGSIPVGEEAGGRVAEVEGRDIEGTGETGAAGGLTPGAFDSVAYDKQWKAKIAESRASGKVHADSLPFSVEGLRGQRIKHAITGEVGVITAATSNGEVNIIWEEYPQAPSMVGYHAFIPRKDLAEHIVLGRPGVKLDRKTGEYKILPDKPPAKKPAVSSDKSATPTKQASSKIDEGSQEVTEGMSTNSDGQSSNDTFANNKIFTSDAVAAARARLAAKRNTLRSGFDPELLQDMLIVGGAHFEAGARRFSAWAKAVIADIGNEYIPFLRGTYENLRYYPNLDSTGISTAHEVESDLNDILIGDRLKEKGEENANIPEQVSGDDGWVSGEEQQEGVTPADEGERPSGILAGDKEPVRRPGGDDNQADDKKPAGKLPEESAGTGQGEVDSKGSDDKRPDRVPSQPQNYRITDLDSLGKGGAKAKAKANIKAIQILKKLQASGRPATPAQQADLVKYVGWGASELANGMFPKRQWDRNVGKTVDVYKEGWQELGEKLKSLLSPKEYAEAQGSTLNAHYTSQEVIQAMYRALERFGYTGKGRILEPGSGIGNFIGLLPASLSDSRFTGVEMDPTTAGISKLLYPGHDIHQADFAAFKAPKDFFDIAIGNPPFLDVKVTNDPDYAKERFLVHDFFFAKSIDKVRPGGLMMLVTSKGTMDKASDKARSYLSKRADLIGAVRLPQTAFKENAGTEVVTDVIFLKKRKDGEQYAGQKWGELKEVKTDKGESVFVNEYFADHPEMVLGTHSTEGTMYGPNQYTVLPKKEPIGKLFDKAVDSLPANIYERDISKTATDSEALEVDFSPDTIKEGGFYMKGDTILQKESGVGVKIPAEGPRRKVLVDYIALRDAVRNVLYTQMKDRDADLSESQAALAKAYDDFVEHNGPINKARSTSRMTKAGTESTTVQYLNFRHFKSDPDAYLVASIEKYKIETGEATKADIFTKRVIDPAVEPDIETLVDALHVSLSRTGAVDIKMIADSMNVTEEEAVAGLEGILFKDPTGNKWVTSDEYLSGNVRAKLAEAKTAVEFDKAFEKNVKALEGVQPADLPQEKIKINLGMPILDPEHIRDFARDEINMGIDVSYLPQDGSWKVNAFAGYQTAAATSDYGTNRVNASVLLEYALNGGTPKVYDLDENRKPVLNKVDTQAAIEKVAKIKETFRGWVWADPARAEVMARRFNDLYNNTVKREFGGDFIANMQFPGMSRVKTPFEHQKRVAWRIIQRGNTYMAHSVGAGKTIASIVAGMEMKRLGIKKKPTWTVPNHMLKQFAGEFLELYPAAKILVADEEQFAKENRNRFMGRVAAENWDAIIITHSAFGMIPMSADFQGQFIDEQIAELDELLQEVAGDRLKRKQIERLKKRLQARLEKVMSNASKDKGVVFEETGIDQIFVDEAHEFRKLDFATNQSDIKGIDPNGSMKAFDLYVKSKYLESLYPNRSLVMMSGTPVTNTLGEIYSIQRFLQEGKLRELGLQHFDSWASTFGGMVTNIEATPAGTYKAVSRFGDLSNIPALAAMWGEIGDFIHARDLPYLVRPKIKGGGRQLVIGETGDLQRAYKKDLGDRIRAIEARKRPPKKGDDIILSVITDGRHAAMDDRYIEPSAPERPDSKMSLLLQSAFDIWQKTKEQKSTQMIFCDLGMPGSVEKRGFSVYSHIKQKLMERGVPENEIAFMQDYKKSDQKTKLFAAMNTGKVRFLIGSSQAMGTGVNAQKKLVALHHFDPDTYLPSNIEQREGRIVRQGNENGEVELYAYVARGSYDETMWQFLETKQRFIDDFLAGNVSSDTASDIDGAADSFAMARAMSSDNPLAIELAGVQNELSRLQSLESAHRKDQTTLRSKREYARKEIGWAEDRIAKLEDAISRRVSTKGDAFKATIDGKSFAERKEAGEYLVSVIQKAHDDKEYSAYKKIIGSIGGFDLRISKLTPAGMPSSVDIFLDDEKSGIKTTTISVGYAEAGSLSPSGLTMRLENGMKDLDSRLSSEKASIIRNEKTIEDAQERIGKKFEYQSILDEKQKREAEIIAELAAEDKAAQDEYNGAQAEDQSADDGSMDVIVGGPDGERTQRVSAELFTLDVGGKSFRFGFHEDPVSPGEYTVSEYYTGLAIAKGIDKDSDTAEIATAALADRDITAEKFTEVINNRINDRGQLNFDSDRPKLSVSSRPKLATIARQGSTFTSQVERELRAFLGKGYDNLAERGKLEIARNAESMTLRGVPLRSGAGRIVGSYLTAHKKVVLFSDEMAQGDAEYIMLHEGGHALLNEDRMFRRQKVAILRDFARLHRTSQAVKDAFAKVPKDTEPGLRGEESLMYFLQERSNHQHGIFRRIISAIRAALYRIGFTHGSALSEADLVALFTQGVKAWSKRKSDQGPTKGRGLNEILREGGYNSTRQASEGGPAFAKWFAGSKVVDENGEPLVVYHGGPKELKGGAFNLGPNEGIFFTNSKRTAGIHKMGVKGGAVHEVYLNLQNPYEADYRGTDITRNNAEESIREAKANGHDGVIIRNFIDIPENRLDVAKRFGVQHKYSSDIYIAFSPNQIKDVKNANPTSDPRIMFSVQAAEAYDTDLQESAGTFYEKIHDKPDMPFLAKIFSTPEYNFKNFPATWKMFNAQLNRHTEKFNLENSILGDFVQVFSKAQKESKAVYEKVKAHLLETDASGKSYRLKHESKWEIKDNDGMVVGYTMTKREGEQVAREAAGKSGKHIKDYRSEKIDVWTVIDPKGAEGDQFLDEQEAVEAMEQAEYYDMVNAGSSKEEAGLVRRFRRMTNTAFDHMIADLRKIIAETDALGLPEPTVDIPDESRRYVIVENGAEIADFTTRADANAAIKMRRAGEAAKGARAANMEVKKRSDSGIARQTKLSEMIAMMSDLRGQYFPRQRQPGGVILRAIKGDDKIMEKFDLYITGRKHIDAETGQEMKRPMSEWLRKRFNQATGHIPFIDTLEKRARQLRAQGYDVTVEKDNKTPESVFDVVHLSSSIDALLREAVGNAKKDKQGINESAVQEINKILTANVADLFKARGYLSSRLRRSDDYWKGFEEDPLLAGTQYARGIAAGIAKRNSAKNMMAAMTGRDQSWVEYKLENPEGTWEEYDAQVEAKRVDPNKQPILHKEALGFMEEVLRNDEQIDRIVGTMKGLAVMKFLGFRVSSAMVNATNMMMGVPATISSQSGGSMTSAFNSIRKSAVAYGKYRMGRGLSEEDRSIFLEITNNGWDQAQFNQENAAVLMSKLGRGWNKFGEWAMAMFGAVEKANRAMSIFAAYKEVRANTALDHDAAMEKAKHISDRAHGVYGKATLPAWARGSGNPLKLTYTFLKFQQNYILNMAEMGLKGDKKQAAYMLLSPVLMGGAGATLVTPLITAFASALGAGDDPEEEFYDWVAETFGSDSIARHGIPGAFGINLKGSIEMNNPIPTTMAELFGAPQAIIKDVLKAGEYAGKGEMMKAGEALLPTAFGSAIKAVREGREGLTTGSYSPVFYGNEPLKATTAEQFVRALSFNPSRISGIREKQWHEKQVAAKYNKKRSEIIEKFKRYYLFDDGNYQELMKEYHHYNELVKGSGRKDITLLSKQSIKRAVARAKKPNRTERLRP